MIWYHALFSFQGRLNRQGFWIGFGINFLFLFIVANFIWHGEFAWWHLLPLAFSLYSTIAVVVKRLHDRNRSGKAAFILLVPFLCYFASYTASGTMAWLLGVMMPIFIGTMLLMEWGGFKGYPEPNQYGEKGLSVTLK